MSRPPQKDAEFAVIDGKLMQVVDPLQLLALSSVQPAKPAPAPPVRPKLALATMSESDVADMRARGMTDGQIVEADRKCELRIFRAEVLALPEAQERPRAARSLVDAHTPATMTVARAAATLRGLPTETAEIEAEQRAAAEAARPIDPREARRIELQGSMTAFNRRKGYRAAR